MSVRASGRWRARQWIFVVGLLGMLGLPGCATAPARHRPVEMEEYLYPVPEPGSLRTGDSQRLRSAWARVVAGKTDAAERRMAKLRARNSRATAPLAGLGYARLRARRLGPALDAFKAALAINPSYAPALAGAALAAGRSGDLDAALGFYQRLLEQPGMESQAIKRHYGEVRLQVTEAHIAAGQAAIQAGDTTHGAEELRAALVSAPELSTVRLQLANLLAQADDTAGAIEVLSADPAGNREVLLRLGELLSQTGDHAGALTAYQRILSADPSDEAARRLAAQTRRTIEFLQMPAEYRHIYTAPRITRADLAGLLAVKVTSLARLQVGGEAPVATDISGSWAREYVIRMLALGVMETYPNHTFQPAAVVRRGELALSVARILDLAGWPTRPGPVITDMSRAHLHYAAVSRVVAAGLMQLTPSGAFEPWRPVTGPQAVAIVDSLASLVQR